MKASLFWKGIQQSSLIIEMMIQKYFMGFKRLEVVITFHVKVFLGKNIIAT